MANRGSSADSNEHEPSCESIDEPDEGTRPTERKHLQTSRRQILATCGVLSVGGAFGIANASGEKTAGTTPDTFAGFKNAVDGTLTKAQSVINRGPYSPTWNSLDNVDPVPDWFRDAKFGIYFHLGLYSVPAFDSEWYPRNMYNVGESVYEYHTENYGSPAEFPYQDFAPEFTAENFDADELADLFQRAGARFGGLVTKHADGWSNWDSDINHWNAGDRGPKRDLVDELESAIHDRNMRFVTTFHHAYKYGYDYYEYAFENFPEVTQGYPERIMYGNISEELFHDEWLAETIEALEAYTPDLIYFDSGLETISERNRQRLLAYYYNQAAEQERDVVVTHKQSDLPLDVSVKDYEEGGTYTIADQAWLADTPISTFSWGYVQDQEYKSVGQILHLLIDAVSKNGQLMLNLSPRADGTIPGAQRERLLGVGDWLDMNGEAIYETRPWDVYGRGPHWGEDFTAEDVRYTQSKDGDTVYAIIMGWPDAGELTLQSTYVMDVAGPPEDANPPEKSNMSAEAGPPEHAGASEVTLLGHGTVPYSVDENNHLTVEVPDLPPTKRPSEDAVVFKLSKFDLRGVGADYVLNPSDIYAARVEEGLHEVTVTVYNLARGEAPSTTVRVENASTGERIGKAELDALPLYGNDEVTVEWDTSKIPDGSTQRIRAIVDPTDKVPEQDDSNNSATTTVELPAWPVDLVPEPVSVAGMTPGNKVELAVEVENQGTQASEETGVRIVDVTSDSPTEIANLTLPSLDPDSSEELVYTWDTSGFQTGTVRKVRAIVDPGDKQPERSESNNTAPTTAVKLLGQLPDGYDTYASTDAVFGAWNENLVVSANGQDIWDETDEYGALYDPTVRMGPESTAIVQVVSQEKTDSWAKAGLMIRNDVTSAGESAGYAAMMVTGDNGFEFEWDSDANGYVDSSTNVSSSTRPCWLKLDRNGNTFTASFSTDGQTWKVVGSADVPATAKEQGVAMFVSSHTSDDRSTVEFDGFEVR